MTSFSDVVHAYLTSWAENFNGSSSENIRCTNRQARMVVAVDTWASAEVTLLVFLEHGHHTTTGEKIPRMNETLEHLSSRFN